MIRSFQGNKLRVNSLINELVKKGQVSACNIDKEVPVNTLVRNRWIARRTWKRMFL